MKLLNQSLILIFMVLNCNCETVGSINSSTTAEGPSYAAVSAAIEAAQPGDTVTIPAGTATWDRPLVITKSIILIGAGIDQTIINSTANAGDSVTNINSSNALFAFVPTYSTLSTNPAFRLSGMTLNFINPSFNAIWLISGTAPGCFTYPLTNIRIDHMKIVNAYIAIGRYGTVYGVCDNCQIDTGTFFMSNTSNDDIWLHSGYEFGDINNFYFEDNTVTGVGARDMCSDGNHSPRFAIRYNTFDLTGMTRAPSPLVDNHGNMAGTMRAGQGFEFYENIIISGGYGPGIDQRGGKVICFNNTVTGTGASLWIRVREENDDRRNPTGANAWGIAGKNLITGQPQHISDSYYWNNTVNNALVPARASAQTVNYGPPLGIVPQENREFWNQNTSFDGTSGIGVGPLANRPTTCTVGVAYWATDTRTLYRCTATNVWTEYYKPYPYPHPLRNAL